jgi:hypothetical protein
MKPTGHQFGPRFLLYLAALALLAWLLSRLQTTNH